MEVEAAADERGKKGAPGGGGGGGGLEWELERQYDFEREMMLMAAAAPGAGPQQRRRQRPFTADLLQNCNLPPPAKLFGPVQTLQRLESAAGADQKGDAAVGGGNNDSLQRGARGAAGAGLGGAVRAPPVGHDAGGRELPAQRRRRRAPPRRGAGAGPGRRAARRRRRGGRVVGRARGLRRHRRRRARARQAPLLKPRALLSSSRIL